MSSPSTSNTIKFSASAITTGVPNAQDASFTSALNAAMAGGSAMQSFFNADNDTSAFWAFIAQADSEGYDPFTMGVTSDNQLVMMASSGNCNFRLSFFYNDDPNAAAASAADGDTHIVSIGQMQLGNTTTNASKWASFGLSVAEIPVGIVLTRKLFAGCLKPLFKNAATWLKTNAQKIYERCTKSEPVFAEETAEETLDETDPLLEETPEIVEDGVEYLAVDWTSAIAQVAGLGILAAVPLIASMVGHPMYLTVSVINQTTLDFTWSISYQASGKSSALPGSDTTVDYSLPKTGFYTDQWGDKTLQPVAYEADFQFINSSDYGSIGLVITLVPADGSTPAQLVVSVPWAGTNTIWVGESSSTPSQIYATYSVVNNSESLQFVFPSFKVTLATNALSGKNSAGQYAYAVIANIEKLSA